MKYQVRAYDHNDRKPLYTRDFPVLVFAETHMAGFTSEYDIAYILNRETGALATKTEFNKYPEWARRKVSQ